MNDFVAECRSVWKRLGVPDPVANEMAADLAADLEEAAAEGVSAEEVLGSGALTRPHSPAPGQPSEALSSDDCPSVTESTADQGCPP